MTRSLPAALLLALAACAPSTQVVREGPGWRETKPADAPANAPTKLELTSDDPAAIATVARTHADPKLRGAALEKTADPAVRADVALKDVDPALRKRAVALIVDKKVLDQVAQKDADEAVRAIAGERRDLFRTIGSKHPEHAGWTSQRSGTWVRFRTELREGEWTGKGALARILVQSTPESVTVEQKDAETKKPLEGRLKQMIARADAPAGRTQEGEEVVDVAGRKTSCRTIQHSGEFAGVITKVKVWLADGVPGGVVRVDVEEAPIGEPLRFLRLLVLDWSK